MNTQKINLNNVSENKKQDENILVIKRDYLFPKSSFQGLQKPSESVFGSDFLYVIMAKKEFLPRSLMEQDFNYKQVIPYLIFKHEEKYFLMQRKAKASETRLQSKYSLGIGGHIRQEDIRTEDIAQWANREFLEEIDYSGKFEIKFLGILNDDSNDVGKVHVGFVYLLEGDSSEIYVKEELESGVLLTIEELHGFYDRMEPWSKIVLDFLK
ncbi:MAG: hypothetical protein UR12_C0035G0001 [candidate division TM6 bacterium GW2011_GWF2_30_66]|nr:MAG: hypothetical protein UR12_C0035G0001 [candidate division TM6 bacterium GW2011_GWF2_30_66]